MGIDVSVQTHIRRPRSQVAAFAMDPGNDTTWIGGISHARALTPAPIGKGTQVERVAGFLGRRIEYVLEVVEHEPEALMAMRSVRSPFPMAVTYRFEEAEGGTLAHLRVEGEAGGFFSLASPLMALMVKRNISRDIEALKAALEGKPE